MPRLKKAPSHNEVTPIFEKKLDYSKFKKSVDNYHNPIFEKKINGNIKMLEIVKVPKANTFELEYKYDYRIYENIDSKFLLVADDLNLTSRNFVEINQKEDSQNQEILEVIRIFRDMGIN